MNLESTIPLAISNRIIYFGDIWLFVTWVDASVCDVGVNLIIEQPRLEKTFRGFLEQRITVRHSTDSKGFRFDLKEKKTQDYSKDGVVYRITLKAIEYIPQFTSYYPDFSVEVVANSA